MSRNNDVNRCAGALDGTISGQRCCLTKRSGGTGTTISRGLGSTKVASANMAPYPSPKTTPTNTRTLIKLGMAANPCGPLGAPLRGEYDHFRPLMASGNFGEANSNSHANSTDR